LQLVLYQVLQYTGRGKSIIVVGLAQSSLPLNTTIHYFETEIVDPGRSCYIAIGLTRRASTDGLGMLIDTFYTILKTGNRCILLSRLKYLGCQFSSSGTSKFTSYLHVSHAEVLWYFLRLVIYVHLYHLQICHEFFQNVA